jgi:hypothetical protein
MEILIHRLFGVTMLVTASLLAGCAFGTREPTLIYPPAPESAAIPLARAVARPAAKSVQITLLPFSDQRADKKVVGTMRNGFGMRTADVIPTNSVPDWVTLALKTELQDRGYTVAIGTPADSASTGAIVSGEIVNVFCDMYMSYAGQVSLRVRASKTGKEVLNKHYSGTGSAGIAWGGTAESFAQSLALALESTVKQFAVELDQSLVAP